MSKKATIQFTAEHEAAKMFEEVLKRNGISDYEFGYIDGVSVFHAENVEWDKESNFATEVVDLIMSLMNKQYDDKPDYAFILFIGTESGIEEYCNKRGYRSLDVGLGGEYGVHNPYLVGSNWNGDDNTPIPGTIVIHNNGVTKTDENAVTFQEYLTYYMMSKGITEIGDRTFVDCFDLKSIEIPTGVTKIGVEAFSRCLSLTSIELPSGITEIGNEAFACCNNLTDIRYNGTKQQWDKIKKGEYWFRYVCTRSVHCSDGDVELPDHLIEGTVYKSCLTLLDDDYIIPDGVTEIGERAFAYCYKLSSVVMPDSVTKIGNAAFRFCHSLKSVKIPDSVATIEEHAFAVCPSLESIELPDSVTEIGDKLFYNSFKLTDIRYSGTKSQWDKIKKGEKWCDNSDIETVHCVDGDVNL